jgi:hypothetical protein
VKPSQIKRLTSTAQLTTSAVPLTRNIYRAESVGYKGGNR